MVGFTIEGDEYAAHIYSTRRYKGDEFRPIENVDPDATVHHEAAVFRSGGIEYGNIVHAVFGDGPRAEANDAAVCSLIDYAFVHMGDDEAFAKAPMHNIDPHFSKVGGRMRKIVFMPKKGELDEDDAFVYEKSSDGKFDLVVDIFPCPQSMQERILEDFRKLPLEKLKKEAEGK
jgi:hypothetical protein